VKRSYPAASATLTLSPRTRSFAQRTPFAWLFLVGLTRRQGAMVVVSNRNRVVDADGHGPADRVADQITAAGGEAVTEYSDAADPGAGQAMVAAALRRWGRLDICAANAAIGVGGMFHKQPAEEFDEVLAVNLQGSIRLARAAMAVMRPAGYGRIILRVRRTPTTSAAPVASSPGPRGDPVRCAARSRGQVPHRSTGRGPGGRSARRGRRA
jgi:NAD(P)-dependent dehydrogenase (short-subunit alcohol dehydrogenase family)